MHTIYKKLTVFTTLCALIAGSLHSQEVDSGRGYYPDASESTFNDSAYADSVYSAHWSAYVPITVLIAAALFFGAADKNRSSNSSSSKDALGSLGKSSKKHSSSSRYSKSYNGHL